ncbi:GNAT family N-acetyltransferase [Arthrobacter sp. MYb227]|uniref:GNAT family N-acetyltransferase n=1 Tax=Arthrobacter sp. MYb227 TaxID=1848601 RepID=UPI000CFC778E|nr:GNAT family N-acetyltransferase [Arthrobacter sp. MYb227]PQZ93664.1 GNAT family N-acetyltransferase [Arthrobacter sp. MYb227]
MHGVRIATQTNLDTAAKVLASAFADYPWTRWVLPADEYQERLEEIQRLYLAHASENGIVVVDDRVRAVAAFLPPNAPAPSAALQQRVAELHGSRLETLMSLELPQSPEGSWTFETVGVEPTQQGLGLGTAVLSHGLALIDAHEATISLETSDERNVRLYERLGFKTNDVTTIPNGPMVYSMARPTQSIQKTNQS